MKVKNDKLKADKTNAMRLLEQAKLPYNIHTYDSEVALSGTEVAGLLGQDVNKVFKTLVTVGKSGNYYVYMVPVAEELDLKKAAKVVGEKSIDMIKSKDLLGLTGYIHGGCSPIGMKKFFATHIHFTATEFDTIIFSGGRIGLQIEMSYEDLKKLIRINTADIIV